MTDRKSRSSGGTAAATAGMPALRSEHAVSRLFGDEAVIVESRKGLVNVVNVVGSRIWELADGAHTADDIAGIIGSEYDVTPDAARKDTLAFLEDMASKGLISFRKADR